MARQLSVNNFLKLSVEAINGEVPDFYYGYHSIPRRGGSDLRLDLKPGPNLHTCFHPRVQMFG